MALSTWTNVNNHNDPPTMTAIDSATFSAPFDRPSTRTPQAGYVAPTSTGPGAFGVAGGDYGVGSTPTARPQNFEPATYVVTLDPGLAVSG